MNDLSPPSTGKRTFIRKPPWIWLGVAAVLAGMIAWVFTRESVPEISREELILKDSPAGPALYLAKEPEVLFSGWMTEVYPDGRAKSRSRVVDGRLHGVSEGWYPEGGLEVQETFKAGVADGPVTKWHPDGTMRSQGAARAGHLDGVFRRWHANGVLAEEITMREGLPHGRARAWNEAGELMTEVMMEAGQVLHRSDDRASP